ncbi:hypothetical protein ACKVMT_00785 [Halobacteriales archaeon Cl-PHB]
MRYKVVPPVRDVAFLYDASEALPIVPDSVEDCCTRIRDGTDLPSRDVAREFLTFMEALGLAREAERGYHRVRDPPAAEALPARFRERVYAVDEMLEALEAAEEPVDPHAVFDEVRDVVPRWERDRHADWAAVWTDRVERLLEWAVVFGLVERTDEGYRPA